jgi:DNA integrity scanning protein DisA with diadenylate cyclase activity
MQRFLSLGTDCVRIQEAADSSKGIFSLFLMLSHCFLVFIPFYSHLLTSYSLLAAALDQALACVAALEAELKTTAEALKDANAAKVSADKAAKAAETKAKRA